VTTLSGPDSLVSFRDADEPRALASRFIAVAHRRCQGWTATLTGDGSTVESITFEAAASAVISATGVRHLLIVWIEKAV